MIDKYGASMSNDLSKVHNINVDMCTNSTIRFMSSVILCQKMLERIGE